MAVARDNAEKKQENNTTIQSITFDGLKNTGEHVIIRELINMEGKDFSSANWEIEKNRFESLDLFASVSMEVEEKEQGLELKYSFKELPSFIPFVAVKITDQNGWMFGPAVAFLNLMGSGIRLEAFARTTVYPDFFASNEYLLYITSQWLGSLPIEYEIFIVQNDTFNSLKMYDETSLSANSDFFHRITRNFKILYTGEIFWVKHDDMNPDFTVGDYGSSMFLSESGSDIVPKLGAGILWDTRDKLLNPHYGIFQELRISKYGGFLGGPADYMELLFDFRGFYTIKKKNIFHASVLGQWRPGEMGAYDYFNVGGTNTLRPYSPTPELYGQHELLGTIEYRYEFFDRINFSILGFNLFVGLQWVIGSDIAVLWDNETSFNDGRLHAGFFTGFHILIPGVDRFRIEMGIVNAGQKSMDIKFGYTMGLYEKSKVQRWSVR